MYRNYLAVTVRNLVRYKAYSVINIVGLAIGLAGCLLISWYVIGELSFEECHLNADLIYRVQGTFETGGGTMTMARAVAPLAPVLDEEFPEVEAAVCLRQLWTIDVRSNPDDAAECYAFCAGPELLEVFTLPLVIGNPATALDDPHSVLISQELAERHFGRTNPMGARLVVMDSVECTVTGVMRNIANNTQLHCDLLLSYATLEHLDADVTSWDAIGEDYVYVLLAPGSDPVTVDKKLPGVFSRHLEKETANSFNLSLFPLKDIYLHSNLSWELQPTGDLGHIYLFGSVALLLLLMACANFINLTTARTAHRLKEVGVRKVLGAFRGQLLRQFVGESLLISTLAMVLGLVLFEVAQPPLEAFLGRSLAIEAGANLQFSVLVLGLIVVVGLIAGSYPALLLSRLSAMRVLNPGRLRAGSRALLRRVFVVFQFALAVALIFCVLGLYRQIDYLMTKDLGFDPDDAIVFNVEGDDAAQTCRLLKHEFLKLGDVESATMTGVAPGMDRMWLTLVRRADQPEEEPQFVQYVTVDHDFLSTFDIELAAGRFFDEDVVSDKDQSILINQTAVEQFELEEPIGHQFVRSDETLTVVGVVKDYHQLPVNNPNGIMPMLFMLGESSFRAVAVELRPDSGAGVLASLRRAWEKVLPEVPFEYTFLRDEISSSYDYERNLRLVITVFGALAGLIACLGVFGLASLAAERRTKEIGVRKVLGASVSGLVSLLTREYVVLSVVSSVIALPLVGYFVNDWLQRFPFQTELGADLYLVSALTAVLVALIAAGVQALKAARANPVEALRYE